MSTPSQGRNSVFISYSHKDGKYFERLKVHLAPQIRAGLDVWDDTRIDVGQLWREEIDHALRSARVGILLVSADYLASEFIAENELPPLLSAAATAGTRIISVIVGACNFTASPVARYQAFNAPSKPLNTLRRAKRDEVWVQVAAEVARLMSDGVTTGGTPAVSGVSSGEHAADAFWTVERVHELERDLEVVVVSGDFDEDAGWLRERLRETDESEKARMLTIWDSISELQMVSEDGGEKGKRSSRLIGYLRDWRGWRGG